MTDTGRRVGPVEPRDPITGERKSIAARRRALNPVAIARKEGWTIGHFLGDVALRKDDRQITLNADGKTFVSGLVRSDTDESDRFKTTHVHSSLEQVRAALKGTLCTCGPRFIKVGLRNPETLPEFDRLSHEESCPLSEVA